MGKRLHNLHNLVEAIQKSKPVSRRRTTRKIVSKEPVFDNGSNLIRIYCLHGGKVNVYQISTNYEFYLLSRTERETIVKKLTHARNLGFHPETITKFEYTNPKTGDWDLHRLNPPICHES